jgi:excisionase family DNA binding protein
MELLTVQETVGICKMTTHAIYRAIKAREIPHVRIGSRIRIPRNYLEKWLEDQAAKSVQDERGAAA